MFLRGGKKKKKISITCYVTLFCFPSNENKFSSQLHQALPFAFVIILTNQTTSYMSSPPPQVYIIVIVVITTAH